MIEKKLIVYSVLAIVIGIAVITPLKYMMTAEAQANNEAQAKAIAQATAALTNVEPWFNVSVQYAFCDPHKSGANFTTPLDGAVIEAVANFSLTPDALDNADAQIEYYKFAVSSDEGPIADLGYYVSLEKEGVTTGMAGNGTIWFANGLVYNGPASNGGQSINCDTWQPNSTLGYVVERIFATDATDIPTALSRLRNAQKLYIDVSKVSTVTVKGNLTITTPASDQILAQIELTKTDNGFAYGSYIQGTMCIFPLEGATTNSTPQIIIPPSNDLNSNSTLLTP